MNAKYSLTLLLFFTGFVGISQDKITTKNAEVFSGTIISISPQIIYFNNASTTQKDSVVTENVAEIISNNTKRTLVLSESERGQVEMVGEQAYMDYLKTNNVKSLLLSKTLLNSIIFYPGRYVLTSGAQKQLSDLATTLLANKVNQVVIEVHTDSSGSALQNLELSEKRAQSIKDFLTEKGFKETQISVVGKGEGEPMFGGVAQQVMNRRVELRVTGIEDTELLYSEKYVAPEPPKAPEIVQIAPSPSAGSVAVTEPQKATEKKSKKTREPKVKAPKLEKTKAPPFASDDRKLTVQLSIGTLGTYPLGLSIGRSRDVFAEEAQLTDSVNSFQNTIWPAVFVSGGVEARYLLSPGWMVVGGVRYARQGFSLKKQYDYTDPIYQYDETYKSRISYQINSLEIPVYVQRQLGDRLSVGLGATITAAVSERQQKIVYSKKVTINGKNSKDDAIKKQELVNDIGSYTKGLTPTALFNLNYQTKRHWGGQFRVQYSLNQFKEKAQVYNASAFLGLTYLF